MRELWRVAPELLEQAQDDAALLALRAMEQAGIDIVTDGEVRRESYSNHFVTALSGIDDAHPDSVLDHRGVASLLPRVVGKIRRERSVHQRDLRFLRANTRHACKVTLPGPFTMTQQAKNQFYGDDAELALDFAAAVNEEAHALQAAGAKIIQIDEPWLRNDPKAAERYAVPAINRALQGLEVTTVVHLCFGYAAVVHGEKPTGYTFLTQLADSIVQQISIEAAQPKLDLGVLKDLSNKQILLGVIDLGAAEAETPDLVASRIRKALQFLPPERLIPAPDCGMKYMSRELASAKLTALAQGAAIVRGELT
jgi:5-methyltetrahydropteroyltriglutamate--homocysteine methyltransferase